MIALERRTWLRLFAALVVGAVLAAVLAVLPGGVTSAQALSDTSPPDVIGIEIDDIAVLQVKGAAVEVRVFARCARNADFRDIVVRLTQKSGPGVATGTGVTQDFFCSGALETVDVTVNADPFGRTFKRADALAEAEIYTFYSGIGDFSASDSEVIGLRKTR